MDPASTREKRRGGAMLHPEEAGRPCPVPPDAARRASAGKPAAAVRPCVVCSHAQAKRGDGKDAL